MATGDIRRLKRLIGELGRAKNNQTIGDLDDIADEFGCTKETTSANENRIYYAPFRDLQLKRVTVAIPHHGKVKSAYVRILIRMFEEVIGRLEEIKKEQEEGESQ